MAGLVLFLGAAAWSQERPNPEGPVGPVTGRSMPFLERLRQENPKEYERLTQMRDADPGAFKQAVRRKMESMRGGAGQEFGPQGPQRGGPGRRMKDGMEWMEQLRKENPEELNRLLELRKTDPSQFSQEVRKFAQERRGSMHRSSEMIDEERKCQELGRLYHESEDAAERERIRTELRGAVEASFDRQVKVRREWIDEMMHRIEEGRKRLAEREAQRSEVCEDRVHELTRDPKLKWDQRW